MGTNVLSSRAIIGGFYEKYEGASPALVGDLTMKFDSDQGSETYKWLGMVPQMREWIGGRQAKGLRDNGFTIENKKYESTLEIPLDDIRRDKTGQIMTRINEMAAGAADLPLTLLSTLIQNGETGVCYDGQYFFDTDHSEGDSGVQSNDLSIDISDLAVDVHGSITAPSSQEMAASILKCIQQIYSFKDDQGRPVNRNVREFAVVVPISLWSTALAATTLDSLDKGQDNLLRRGQFNVKVYAEPLIGWTDKIAVFAVDGTTKPFIHQIEQSLKVTMLDENSEYAHSHDAMQFGTKAIENIGYGMWYRACLGTLV